MTDFPILKQVPSHLGKTTGQNADYYYLTIYILYYMSIKYLFYKHHD